MDKVGKDFVLGIVLDILTVKLEVFRGRTASYNNRKVQIVQLSWWWFDGQTWYVSQT